MFVGFNEIQYKFRLIDTFVPFILYFSVVKCDIVKTFFLFGFQDYFTHFEPSQSLGGAKNGDTREKPPDHLQAVFVCCLAHRGSTVGFLLLQCSSGVVRHPRDLQVSVATRFCRVLIFASS